MDHAVVSGTDPVDAAAVSALIDGVYACVLDRGRWPGVLESLCHEIGGCAASLNIHNLATRVPELLVEHGTDPVASRAYVETYAGLNPLIDAILLYIPPGQVDTVYRTADLPAFRRSRFYREWVGPQAWGDWLSCVLIRTTSSLAMLAVARRERDGPFSPQDVEFVRLLAPHLQRATMLSRVFDDRDAKREGLSALVDRIRAPAFLVNPAGTVAFVNAAGEQLLAEGSVLQARDGRLTPCDGDTRRRFAEALYAEAGAPVSLVFGPPQDRRLLWVAPASAASGGHSIVLVTSREDDLPLPGPLLVEAFGLTAAEIRVLVALLKRRTMAEIAQDLGITPRTAKAHLQHLFEKTGTRRQADLLAEVMALVPPISVF
ncbi:helix-turn-helix transcriptional regulator [Phenylobacterium sp.]|uniref:helix-turn-helix transcriptional regulator n=1 Tax=Phenylobacterium sp. TaxID=1871053 RepID=UPI00121390D3|nr:helix-turn-helix transcriptional regulator [Phenylobacterium sp.]THD64996.1 MAG: LuxR family transcriptional regulator [Phenylobacterium sp.]